MKIIFAGFRHGHINLLYKLAADNPKTEIIACFEPDAETRCAAEKELNAVFSELSYDRLLKTDAEIVAVGARYADRGEIILKALRAGKHILADKPLCRSRGQLELIADECGKRGLKIGCMLDLRYLPQVVKAKGILNSGSLGAVKNVSFSGQHCLSYASRPEWYFEKGMHGGTINDLAIHGIDLIAYLTGLHIKRVDAARCRNGYAYLHKDFKDCALFMAELSNGAGLLADVSYSAPPQVFSMPTYWDFKFWCEKGLLTFCAAINEVRVYADGSGGAEVLKGTDAGADCLCELIAEIENNTVTLTDSVLKASFDTLSIQEAADKA